MSDEPQLNQPNPFAESAPVTAGLATPAAPRKPGILTAICVVAILLGVMGLFNGGGRIMQLLVGRQMQRLFTSMSGASGQMRSVQDEMNAAVWEETRRFMIPLGLLGTAQLLLAACLVYAGIRTLQLRERGRKILAAACASAIFYELANAILFYVLQFRLMPIMETYMQQTMQATPGANPGAEQFGLAIAKMSIIAGFVLQGGWLIVKLGFYAYSTRYLRTPQVRALMTAIAAGPSRAGK